MTTLPIQTTDEARAFLVTWMRRYFPTDRTFFPYITEHLAGDFAFQLANALAVPVTGSAGDALEAAAQLVIQRTSVPRDLLGPATAQMKAKAAAGEQLAAAIRSLRPAASGSDETADAKSEMGEILRKASNNPGRTANDIELLTRAADECDRFYGGMMNWKANAQAKDRTIIALGAIDKTTKPLAHGHRDDYHLMANARRLMGTRDSRRPNWAIAADLFATGSNSARQICYDAGIDPDGVTVERRGQRSATVGNVECPKCMGFGWQPGAYERQPCGHCQGSATNSAGATKPLTRCAAGRDGECGHAQCPQLRDGEPANSGRHCPLDTGSDE